MPQFTDNGVSYIYSIKSGTTSDVIITGTTGGLSGNKVIPSTFANDGITYTVKEFGVQAFYPAPDLTSITIPASVTAIHHHYPVPDHH